MWLHYGVRDRRQIMEQNSVRNWAWQVEGPLTGLDADFLQLRVWITCCPKKHCEEKGPYWLELAHSPQWSKAPQRQFTQFITPLWFMHSSPFGQKLSFLLLLLTKVGMPAKMPGGREMQTPATLNEALEGVHSLFKLTNFFIFEMGFSPFQTGALWYCRHITEETTTNTGNNFQLCITLNSGKPE